MSAARFESSASTSFHSAGGQVEDIDERHSQLEKLDEDYDKWHAEIKRQEEDLQKIRGELAEVQGSQPTQTQNPEHSSEMKRLSKERQDITTTVSAAKRAPLLLLYRLLLPCNVTVHLCGGVWIAKICGVGAGQRSAAPGRRQEVRL